MTITFNKEIYTREALIKAAYKFSDKAYIHLDMDDIYYLVDVDIKPGHEEITEKEFILSVDPSDGEILELLRRMVGKMQRTLDVCRSAVTGRTPYVITQEHVVMEEIS